MWFAKVGIRIGLQATVGDWLPALDWPAFSATTLVSIDRLVVGIADQAAAKMPAPGLSLRNSILAPSKKFVNDVVDSTHP